MYYVGMHVYQEVSDHLFPIVPTKVNPQTP